MTGSSSMPLRTTLLFSSLVTMALQLFYASRLPERVAVHFDLAGRANGWMDRGHHCFTGIAITAFVTLVFFVVPIVTGIIPEKYINTPKKDYWLKPENRKKFSALIGGQMHFAGIMVNLFLAVVFTWIYQYNTGIVRDMSKLLVYAVLPLLAGIIGSSAYLVYRLNKGE
jgi:uncharacterized membrane protein